MSRAEEVDGTDTAMYIREIAYLRQELAIARARENAMIEDCESMLCDWPGEHEAAEATKAAAKAAAAAAVCQIPSFTRADNKYQSDPVPEHADMEGMYAPDAGHNFDQLNPALWRKLKSKLDTSTRTTLR